jgi:hypothetical protein
VVLNTPHILQGVIAALALAVLSATPDAGLPPQLSCLSKWYAAEPIRLDGGWGMKLGDGVVRPFDDGLPKAIEEKVAAPDMQDTFSIPYRTGPIVPVNTENDDPGRIRFDPIFAATYGHSAHEVDEHLVRIKFFGQKLRVHEKVKDRFAAVEARLKAAVEKDKSLARFLQKIGGTFNWRKIADTDRQSAHSYGISMDINVAHSHYWEWQRPKRPLVWQNKIPQVIVDAFEAEGFIWGGRWQQYDTMHFEYRPELLEPACR